jgi:hypothetical protein
LVRAYFEAEFAAQGRHLHQPGDALLARRFGDGLGAHGVDRLEALATGLVEHADQVHRRRRAVQGALHRGGVADIGLDEIDLADVAEHPHAIGEVGIAHRDPDAPAGLGELPHRLGADEARTAEDRDEILHESAPAAPGVLPPADRRCARASQSSCSNLVTGR